MDRDNLANSFLKTTKVQEVLGKKYEQGVLTIKSVTTIKQASAVMKEKDVGLLVVYDQDVVGVISERDVVRRGVMADLNLESTPVDAIMTKKVAFVHPDDTIEDCIYKFQDYRCRHLPVSRGKDGLVGVLSDRDLLNFILAKLQEEHFDLFKKIGEPDPLES